MYFIGQQSKANRVDVLDVFHLYLETRNLNYAILL